MQKARSQLLFVINYKIYLLQLVSAWFQVLFHSSVRSAFHLSFTVLVHYRSLRSIQPYQMVLADSRRISPVPRYSGYSQVANLFNLRDYHPLWFNFPEEFNYKFTVHDAVLQPQSCLNKAGLGCSPFARHYLGNHYCFLVLRLLRCFSSPGQPLTNVRFPVFNRKGCPIRKSSDQRLFAPSRSLSQLITSFFASESQGILHTLFVTFFLIFNVLKYTYLNTRIQC